MYNQAIKPLQLMSLRSDIQLMLFSGTKQSVLDEIVKHLFDKFGIKFLHVNDYFSNDPIPITNQNFTKKPYYSILWDDKAGFSFDYDWPDVEFFINDYSIIF
jgi:hypothetical protein